MFAVKELDVIEKANGSLGLFLRFCNNLGIFLHRRLISDKVIPETGMFPSRVRMCVTEN